MEDTNGGHQQIFRVATGLLAAAGCSDGDPVNDALDLGEKEEVGQSPLETYGLELPGSPEQSDIAVKVSISESAPAHPLGEAPHYNAPGEVVLSQARPLSRLDQTHESGVKTKTVNAMSRAGTR
jgi:hypothetical protein